METNISNELKEVPHHIQQNLCTTRPAYRQGRKLTAVKVYTVASESQHLFVYGVPKINLRNELKSLFSKYGQISNIHVVADHKVEIFTECYHIQYQKIQSARIAKRKLDNRSFYGGILHICYAPETESLEETIAKLEQRKKDVLSRLSNHQPQSLKAKEDCLVLNEQEKGNNDQIAPIYDEEDPILTFYKKRKTDRDHEISQKLIDESRFSRNTSKKFIPSSVRNCNDHKLVKKFIGPQLPSNGEEIT